MLGMILCLLKNEYCLIKYEIRLLDKHHCLLDLQMPNIKTGNSCKISEAGFAVQIEGKATFIEKQVFNEAAPFLSTHIRRGGIITF